MNFQVKCIDSRFSKHIGKKLKLNEVYDVLRVARIKEQAGSVMIKDIPGRLYYARRFEVVGKIIINLPEDFDKINI